MQDRRLIEETFPVREVSFESSREKGIRRGNISTLHIWWARRPLASSRASTYASLVNHEAGKSGESKKFIADLSKWENYDRRSLIEYARKEILKNNGEKSPKVLDPFGGGGSIPLEALRLGCEVYSSDYNPVAVLIQKCTLEYPQKYTSESREWKDARNNRLPTDIRKWSNWVLEEARRELEPFYPRDKEGYVPVGYIWARTIPCQNPACGASLPLVGQYWLAKNAKRKIAIYPYVHGKDVRFKVVGTGYEKMPSDFNPEKGSIRRAIATCLVCGSTVDNKIVPKLFRAGKSGQIILAVILHKDGAAGKKYRAANTEDIETFKKSEIFLRQKSDKLTEEWGISPIPDEPLPPVGTLGFRVQRYNMTRWGDLFNSRQLLALITLTEKIRMSYQSMLKQGFDEDYAKAVVSYLGLILTRHSDTQNSLCVWMNSVESPAHLFARQTVNMAWDYVEVNPLAIVMRGTFRSMTEQLLRPLEGITNTLSGPATVNQASAISLPYSNAFFDAVFTDPPYYDNVPYSHLSDFFYVWLKRAIGDLYPELFSTPLTPKYEEIVAYSDRDGGLEAGKKYFEDMLGKSFKEIYRVLKPSGIAIIVYAHKSTAGWETLINSMLDSGLVITAAWPVHTEMKHRLRGMESAALASSIYMVSRKLMKSETGFYREVKNELQKHLVKKLNELWSEGISGADFFIAGIGSAVEVFGKYQKVIDDEGNTIRADRLLEDVRTIVTNYAVKQVLHNGFATEISQLTRFYVLWRWAFGESKMIFDDALKMAQSVGIDLEREWNKGFISKDKEFIDILGPEDRKLEELKNSKELIDVLHSVLLLWKKGKNEDVVNVLKESGFGKSEVFYRVAEAICQPLPNESKEKKLLEGFLAGKERLVKDVRNDSGQRRLFDE